MRIPSKWVCLSSFFCAIVVVVVEKTHFWAIAPSMHGEKSAQITHTQTNALMGIFPTFAARLSQFSSHFFPFYPLWFALIKINWTREREKRKKNTAKQNNETCHALVDDFELFILCVIFFRTKKQLFRYAILRWQKKRIKQTNIHTLCFGWEERERKSASERKRE